MRDHHINAIAAWLIERGLAGASEADLLHGFCRRCCDAGLDLSRAITIIDTLHPVFEGRAFRWRNDGVAEDTVVEYGRTNEGEAAEQWQQSVFHHLTVSGADDMRRRLGPDGPIGDFPQLETFRQDGLTDYLGMMNRFARGGTIGEMECVYSHWITRHPDGFSEADLGALRRLVPTLALAVKCTSLARIAGTLVEVYLGRDAGQRVLSGRIQRGVADSISTVLWFSDLRGFTAITDTVAADEIIPLLNDYADATISSITDAGGDVLKLIGDGILAIFKAGDRADACRCALRAEADLRRRLKALNERRHEEGRQVTQAYLGLHIGNVLYGNIGSVNRLDFTVVGPAVNEVSRISSMCRAVDRAVLLSADFVAAVPPDERRPIVSVGRFALRGVRKSQELFTIDVEE